MREEVQDYTLSGSSLPRFDDPAVSSTRRLPLIDRIAQRLNGLDLKNTLIISVQHLCSTTEILFDTSLQFHFEPNNLYVLGKCYSTNPQLLARLNKKNINAFFSSSIFNSTPPFDLDFDRNLEHMLKQVAVEKDLYTYEKIIILSHEGIFSKKQPHFCPKICLLGELSKSLLVLIG